jgi:glycosidase
MRRPSFLSLALCGAAFVLCSCVPQGLPQKKEPKGPPSAPQSEGAFAWLPRSVGYEIFVRSFADSNGDKSGDLQGITDRLDYLGDLGVDLLWLTPIYPSPSYHGYDVVDYEGVNPQLGTLADLHRLLEQAHRRGMRVLLDLLANHTSDQHPFFLAARQGGKAAGRYLFRDDNPGFAGNRDPAFKPLPGQPGRFYYSFFSGSLPDLNYRDARVLPAMQQVVALWLGRGVDGYRLDAARYLVESPDPVSATRQPEVADTPETHEVWRRLRATATATRPGAALLGEVWSDVPTIASYRGGGDELHGCFHFPMARAILVGVRRDDPGPIRDTLQATIHAGVPPSFFAPFLSNHDQQRSATSLADPARMRLAVAVLMALPGPPFLYYGEEIGMQQSADPKDIGDRAQRAPMPWDEVARQRSDPGSLWNHYRTLIKLHRKTPALSAERTEVLLPTDGRLLAFSRGQGKGKGMLIAVYNLSGVPVSVATVALPPYYPLGPQRDLLTGQPAAEVDPNTLLHYPLPTIPAHGTLWLTGG